ncbi:MAG: hypothetical protein U1E34_04880 [Amaricoccus sp.]
MSGPWRVLAIAVALISGGSPGAAIEVCRPNALGMIACSGQPTHGLDPLVVFPPRRQNLSRVAPANPSFVSGTRTNQFGDTFLREGEIPPPRPRLCRTDTLGNIHC